MVHAADDKLGVRQRLLEVWDLQSQRTRHKPQPVLREAGIKYRKNAKAPKVTEDQSQV